MRYYARRFSLLLGAAVILLGCAKQESGDYDALEAQSFEAWMNANTDCQTNPAFEKTESGLYIYWINKVARDAANPIAKVNDWVRIDYTGKTLQQNIFYTRNEAVAKRQGTFSRRTHYVPNFIFLAETNSTMSKGMYEALQLMAAGDMVRIYMPSSLFNGSTGYETNNIGYNGQWGIEGSKPAIIDSLSLIEISDDPIVTENETVKQIAKGWGLDETKPFRDSTGLYVQLRTPFPIKRDSVAADSTLSFYYKTTFLDGFVVDSNIDSVQQRAWGEIVNYGPQTWDMTVTTSGSTGYYDYGAEALKIACSSACYGDRVRVITTSAYAYGIVGKSGTHSTSSSSSSSSSSLADYYNQLNYYSYLNSMYGGYGSYGYGGYSGMYNNYYSSAYYSNLYNSSSSTSTTEDDTTTKVIITTEILPFAPLIYEIWVVPNDGSGDAPDSNTE